MVFNCYLRDSVVYVPMVAKTTAGFYQEMEPIAVVPVADDVGLRHGSRDAVAYGNPIVPTPARADYSAPPFILKYAKVKSWSTFAKHASPWSIIYEEGAYKITGYRNGRVGGWELDPDRTVQFPAGTPIDEVIERMIAILQRGWMKE